MVDMIYPEVGVSTAELLERLGMEVIFQREQTCCGQPAFNAGYREESRVLARRFLDIFEPMLRSGQVDAIVAPSGSCVTMTSHFYPVLFEDPASSADYQRAQTVAESTFELTEFLVDVLGIEDIGSRFRGKLTYHACCHLMRELGVDEQPRSLLEKIPASTLVEMDGDDECCGFGGLFAIKNPGISTAMGDRKVKNVINSGADVVTLCDVSCMTHINGLLERHNRHCRAVHIAEILNSQVDVTANVESDVEVPPTPPPSRRWQDNRQ